jgi:hypothetical protein
MKAHSECSQDEHGSTSFSIYLFRVITVCKDFGLHVNLHKCVVKKIKTKGDGKYKM